jgi:hypothetical protein
MTDNVFSLVAGIGTSARTTRRQTEADWPSLGHDATAVVAVHEISREHRRCGFAGSDRLFSWRRISMPESGRVKHGRLAWPIGWNK